MSGVLQLPDCLSEEQFASLVEGKSLPDSEREALRDYYGLPCNHAIVDGLVPLEHYVVCAQQRIRGNPHVRA